MKNLLSRAKSGRRKGSLGLFGEEAEEAAPRPASVDDSGAAAAPADVGALVPDVGFVAGRPSSPVDGGAAGADPAAAVRDDDGSEPTSPVQSPTDGPPAPLERRGDSYRSTGSGVSALADDDGMSETSTAWEKERRTGFSRGGSARLAEAARRGDDLEAELRSTRGELRHERARLAALSTRLGAVEATLRLERESMRPEREKLVAMAIAMDAQGDPPQV